MRTILLTVTLLAACKPGPGASEPGLDAGDPTPDAGTGPDAAPPYDPPPEAAPCELLGLPASPPLALRPGEEIFALEDIDRDGRLDLLVTGPFRSNVVGFYRGLPGATFAPEKTSAVADSSGAGALADLDGDGKLDLIINAFEPASFSVMRGDGAGGFQPGPSYPVSTPGPIAAGDLNGDGRLDVAYLSAPGAATLVRVRLNTGDGALGDETEIVTLEQSWSRLALADLDGDGALDMIVTRSHPGTLSILRGNGDATFQPRVDHATKESFPGKFVVTDLNADGHPDLVLAGGSSGISVYTNDGTGAFPDRVDYETPVFLSRSAFVIGDLDRDGKLDVVIDDLMLLKGNGDGTLQPATDTHLADHMGPVAMADLNGDGESDVLLTGLIGWNLGMGVLESDGHGEFHISSHYDLGEATSSVVPADLNNDGYVDLVLSSADLRIALGTPGRLFGEPLATSTPPGSVSVGDFDNDGSADLLVNSSFAGLHLTVSLGNGDGSFRDPGPEINMSLPDTTRVAFTLGDLDNDGKTDILVATGPDLNAFLSNGDGTFHRLMIENNVLSLTAVPTIAEINGDGKADIVVVYSLQCTGCGLGPPHTDVLLNMGNGAFSQVPVDSIGRAVIVADVDGDGKLDLFRRERLRRGNGDGTFQPEVPTGILPFNSALSRFDRLADMTGDGVLDYVMFTPDGLFPVTISQGLGDGTFGSPAGYRGPGGNAAIADLNHDGRLDIVVPGDTFDVMFARCVR